MIEKGYFRKFIKYKDPQHPWVSKKCNEEPNEIPIGSVKIPKIKH